MKKLSFFDFLSAGLSVFLGLAILWGALTLFALSLVFILPILVFAGLAWAGYVWWKLRLSRSSPLEGESREIKITETETGEGILRHIEIINTEDKQ